MSNLERQSGHSKEIRKDAAIEKIGEQQLEKMREAFEKDGAENEGSQREKDAVAAKLDALTVSEETKKESIVREASPAQRRGPITKKQLASRFDHTMKPVQGELPPLSRAFSKFIHSKPIEAGSDLAGKTIARPNALLTGAICAFALTLLAYLFAKNMGYKLSGFETIAAFGIGWLLGMLYDYFRVMITGKKDS